MSNKHEQYRKLEQLVHIARPKFNPRDRVHGVVHASKVRSKAVDIAKRLDDPSIDLYVLEAAALLHDVHFSTDHHNILVAYVLEPWISKRAAEEILKQSLFNDSEVVTILNAIKNHPFSFPFHNLNHDEDLYSQILQDADTIETFSYRRLRALKDQSPLVRSVFWFIKSLQRWGSRHKERFLNLPHLIDVKE